MARPSVRLALSPVRVGESVVLDPRPSLDPDGGVLVSGRVAWGDGSSEAWTGVPPLCTHVYTAPGAYLITITIKDDEGVTGSLTASLVVTPPGPLPPPLTPPLAPTGLAATAGNGQVSLVWNGSSGATSYRVERATVSGGPYTLVTTVTVTTFLDTGRTNGTTYFYVIKAVNSAGASPATAQVSATPTAPLQVPNAPTGLIAVAGNQTVSLNWNASAGATSYTVARSTVNGGPYTVIASGLTALSFLNTGLVNGTTYFYVVRAVNAAGSSGNSTQVSATPTTPPDPNPNAHAYYNSLITRPDHLAHYSLRDQAQLQQFAQSQNRPFAVNYLFPNDPDPRKQDAAKVVIPAGAVSLTNQVRVPIPSIAASESLFLTWDGWFGQEFNFANTGIANYKNFQIASPAGSIWTEVRSDFNDPALTPGSLLIPEIRQYGGGGSNVTELNPLSPMIAQFPVVGEIWTRYWTFFKPASGGFYEFSLWVADVTRNPVQLIDRLLIKPNTNKGATGWLSFWLEYNTSQQTTTAGARVAYVRNVVLLRGLSSPGALLIRPTAQG